MVRVLMGCSILVGDQPAGFDQGGRQGSCAGQGFMGGLAVLRTGRQDKRGKLVEWVEKASFDRLNRLFKIAATERSCETLFSTQNSVRSLRSPNRNNNKRVRGPPLPSVSSGSGRLAGLNHSGPSLSVDGRLALLAEETTSINQPGSPHPDEDAAGASCAAASPPMAPPTEDMGAESQVSCSSVQDDHPEGSEVEMAEENPAAPALVPDGGSPEETQPAKNDGAPDPEEESLSNASLGGNPVDDAACISASSFSYAELEEKLKRIPPGSDVAMPSVKMFDAVEMLVSGLRGMAQQHDLFSDLLRTVDYMKAEASLSAAREDNEALRVELVEVKSREELVDAHLHEAEDEMAQLRGELEAKFAAEREELEADYQKQVDEMYFFGFRCCMKKHGIKRDVPSIPSGEEEKLRGKPAQ
ncbi:hypothetical protein CK203_098055 [Vitis vinifera]|uniref:Uncharacterized protein n=1 Tax=Vitis vinifera TaxID=29760 RepID=A0A438CS22_VITVI|nr:hypothetical protein CK203_098055 [Vitis vinifera]